MGTLGSLAAVFAQLSLVAFGGGNSILPEMQRQVVQVHPWMSARDFAALYALAQAAPGPNMLVSALIGMRVAGLPGALVAVGALCGPSSALTFLCASTWHRLRDRPWRTTLQAGLMPVTAGLVRAGAVRDALAGLPVADIDLATPATPEQVVAELEQAGLRTIPTGLVHGTVTALVDGRGYEITTLRRDVATDGRHAVVAFTDDWRTDAARRDFTLNALSMNRHGAVFDYFGGVADLRARRIWS